MSSFDLGVGAGVQPPLEGRAGTASYERVRRWLADEDVQILAPDELTEQLALDVAHA